MRVASTLLPAVMLLLFACGPKTEKVSAEKISADSTAAAATNLPKDGTATSHTVETPKLVLPQEVISLLTKHYPGWEQPVLVQEVHRQVSGKTQGPLMVKADFDGNMEQDLALQIRFRDEVLMLAFMQQENSWRLHELKRDILFNERGKLKSLYYLFLAEPGLQVRNAKRPQPFKTESASVGIGLDDNVSIFLYQAGAFQAFEVED